MPKKSTFEDSSYLVRVTNKEFDDVNFGGEAVIWPTGSGGHFWCLGSPTRAGGTDGGVAVVPCEESRREADGQAARVHFVVLGLLGDGVEEPHDAAEAGRVKGRQQQRAQDQQAVTFFFAGLATSRLWYAGKRKRDFRIEVLNLRFSQNLKVKKRVSRPKLNLSKVWKVEFWNIHVD